jgi:hypothetical protein
MRRNFPYRTNRRGQIIPAGLTPDETFEFEWLANQICRTPTDEMRFRSLAMECGVAEAGLGATHVACRDSGPREVTPLNRPPMRGFISRTLHAARPGIWRRLQPGG